MMEVSLPVATAIEHLVLDFNGTLALDGGLLEGVKPRLERLAAQISIHIVTGDTFGTARDALAGLPCSLETLPATSQAEAKRAYLLRLGAQSTACIGNGRNDVLMMQVAALSIAVLQQEGAAPQALLAAHVVAPGICEALDLLSNPLRLKATLRT